MTCDPLELVIQPPYIGSAVSPEVDITETTNDVTVTITDFRGEHSYTVEKTDQAIADAEQAASNANTAAANATSTANAAAQYARDTADQAAADAQETADAAAGRADTAAESANQAAQAANTAASTANTAAQNADDKAGLADSKATLANTAATTANQAAEAAEAAKTAATTAAGQATTAAGNANTAAGTANTAAQNADAKAQLADTAAANADTATQAANTATTAATNAAQAANNAADVAIEAAEDMPKLVSTLSTVQVVSDAWETTMKSATLYGKSVQDGTPTPENPVPVHVVGMVNVLPVTLNNLKSSNTDGTWSGNAYTLNGITWTINDDMSISRSGTATGRSLLYLCRYITATIATGTYTALHKMAVRVDSTWTTINAGQSVTLSGELTQAWTDIASGTTVNDTYYPQLQPGTHAAPYTPYGCIGLQTGDTVHAIDLQGHTLASLPDGTRDELDISDAGLKDIAQRVGFSTFTTVTNLNPGQTIGGVEYRQPVFAISGIKIPSSTSDNILSNMFTPTRSWEMANSCILNTNGRIYAYIEARLVGDTVESANAYFAAHPVTFYYELAEPVTHSLGTITLTELSNPCTLAIYASLDPEWAIEYEQDPNIVVNALQSSIAPVEGSTASANYAVNSYLMHGNQLYRVTSAIATGEAITPGSNCVACTVMGEVIRLNN